MELAQLKEKLEWYIGEYSTSACINFISDVGIRYDIYSERSILGEAFVINFGKEFMTKIGETVNRDTLADLYIELVYEC